MLPNMRI